MKDIFISYSRHDINVARDIKQRIEASTSAECWMDMEGIESGSQFQDVIISAINETKIVVLLLSESSMKSPWVKREINFANEKGKKVVPINIDGAKPADWFLFTFSGNDVIDFRNKDQQAKFFRDIARWCRHSAEDTRTTETTSPPTTAEGVTASGYVAPWVPKAAYALQYALWGVLGIVSLRITFNSIGALYVGRSILPVILDVLIVGTLVSTYFMSRGKRWAFYAVCALDFLEIYVVCKMGYTAYFKHPEGGYETDVYKILWHWGALIAQTSMFRAFAILSVPAAIHIAAMKMLKKP